VIPLPSSRQAWAIAGAAVLLVLATSLAATRISGLQGTPLDRASGLAGPAPAFTGIHAWLNTGEPLALENLAGRVVLVDFWTYTCINCVRTFPHLRALYATYHPFGLEIVGVHSPEFSFERDAANVAAAIERYRLPYPVALDNDMQTWRAYRNNFWPRVYLIDAQGQIRFDHIGEGGQEQIQDQVRLLLAEAGVRSLPDRIDFSDTSPTAHITPEIYAGATRGTRGGHLANPEGYRRGRVTFAAPTDEEVATAGTSGRFFLQGPWDVADESVTSAGNGARVIVPFFARDVFLVATGGAQVRVLLDGAPVDAVRAGADVGEDSVIDVRREDLFAAIRLPRAAGHVLTLEAAPGFELFAFTFG
jgi:thiol-disulfide isomerase/thioredoxin